MSYDTIILDNRELSICLKYTKNCCIGGVSEITKKRDPRSILIQNFVGQVGTLAGTIYLLGREEGLKSYIRVREIQDKDPYKGDGGQDIEGRDIDIKCSYMRGSPDPLDYNFLLRTRDIHPNWTYLQTLAERDRETNNMKVHMMGWVKTEDLPKEKETYGPFKGAYKIPMRNLRKFPIE